ncbi:MAG: ATP-dependent DNA helicase RecG [Eubacteriales bacterium]|nr:ATP-dependent DNA helicase RecG [Eubacteriales bacterium]
MQDIPLKDVRGIGPARLKALTGAGITTVRALVAYLPSRYIDLTDVREIGSLMGGEVCPVRARICGPIRERRAPRLLITQAELTDDTGSVQALWYNQPWLKKNLEGGRELLLYGPVVQKGNRLTLQSPTFESEEEPIRPVYRAIGGIPPKALASCIQSALKMCEGQWKDELPESLRMRHGLCERNFAMRQAHLPESKEALECARYRLAFEELLLFQTGLMLLRSGAGRQGVQIDCTPEDGEAFWNTLPFAPTGAQRRALAEILRDMAAKHPMARLVQGDVGCGKTAIAFGAMYVCAQYGWQCALMAPTEILAEQHFESAKELLEPLGIRCGLLKGGMGAKARREAKEAIASGQWQAVIGTHALISKDIEYKNLGLVVTDEQHRFGVEQRTVLQEKGASPNVLVMSATPIPRTLSLILYGDLDITIVDELPPGRTPVKTRVVPESKRDDMYGFLRSEIQKGRQVYIVCPLVDASEAIEAKSAEDVYKELCEGPLSSVRVGLVHGKMKAADKDEVLAAFRDGQIDALVATTVIEVGVNVPNASVMVVENADRYGLSQLHQLRGRVGRGSEVSWCFFMAEPNERLKTLVETNDGFKVAERDLELRGPGELLGTRQSGAVSPGPGAMLGDSQLLKLTHDIARALVKQPDADEARAVIDLARAALEEKLARVGMN